MTYGAIDPSRGPASESFYDLGPTTLNAAARWLKDLPYGSDDGHAPLRALERGFGDCTSKHAALIALAEELRLGIGLVWGIYPLDSDLVPAVGPILDSADLPFVPNIHCFLQAGEAFVDLTEGNCTGKSRQVEDYLALFPASPGDDERPVRKAFAELLTATHPAFFRCSAAHLLAVTDLCLQAKAAVCDAPPVNPADRIGSAG